MYYNDDKTIFKICRVFVLQQFFQNIKQKNRNNHILSLKISNYRKIVNMFFNKTKISISKTNNAFNSQKIKKKINSKKQF